MVQWLGLHTFIVKSAGQSLVGELRSCKPHNMPQKIKKKKKRTMVLFLLYKNTSISSHFQTGYSLVVLLFPYNCVLRIRYLLWVLHQRSPSEDIFLFTSPTASQVHFNKHLFLSFMAANNIVVLLHIFKHLQVYSQI